MFFVVVFFHYFSFTNKFCQKGSAMSCLFICSVFTKDILRIWTHATEFLPDIKFYSRLTLSSLQTNTFTFANCADQDETARNEPFHQDIHCLSFCF